MRIDLSLEAIEKGGYKHFMLKEIMEQPTALQNAMRGRINAETGDITLGGIAGEPLTKLCAARRIIIAACGTSFHSGLVGEYAIETLARVPVEVEYGELCVSRVPLRLVCLFIVSTAPASPHRACSISHPPPPALSTRQPLNFGTVDPFYSRTTF